MAKAKRKGIKVKKTLVNNKGKLQFTTFKGNKTDILHSSNFLDSSYSKREKMAFNKKFIDKLSYKDKLLLQGYAQCLADKNRAYHYNNR